VRAGSVTPCWLRQSRYAWFRPLDELGAADEPFEAAATLPLEPEQAAASSVAATTAMRITARE
jgi:hypothetical protein